MSDIVRTETLISGSKYEDLHDEKMIHTHYISIRPL